MRWETSWWLNNNNRRKGIPVARIPSVRFHKTVNQINDKGITWNWTMTMYQWDVNEWGANAPIGHIWLRKRYVEPLGGQCVKQIVLAIEYLCITKIIPRTAYNLVQYTHDVRLIENTSHINMRERRKKKTRKNRTLNIDIHTKIHESLKTDPWNIAYNIE